MDDVKDPCEVSGWGPGAKSQDYSDIAKKSEVNAEFDPQFGRPSEEPRGAAPKPREPEKRER